MGIFFQKKTTISKTKTVIKHYRSYFQNVTARKKIKKNRKKAKMLSLNKIKLGNNTLSSQFPSKQASLIYSSFWSYLH